MFDRGARRRRLAANRTNTADNDDHRESDSRRRATPFPEREEIDSAQARNVLKSVSGGRTLQYEEITMPLLQEGDAAPAFSLPNQSGAAVTLEQYRGQNVVLWWYPKADTPG